MRATHAPDRMQASLSVVAWHTATHLAAASLRWNLAASERLSLLARGSRLRRAPMRRTSATRSSVAAACTKGAACGQAALDWGGGGGHGLPGRPRPLPPAPPPSPPRAARLARRRLDLGGQACLAARARPRPPRRSHCSARAGGSPWAAAEGQDFLADHASPDIDFATFHAWIDNWKARAPELLALRPAARAVRAARVEGSGVHPWQRTAATDPLPSGGLKPYRHACLSASAACAWLAVLMHLPAFTYNCCLPAALTV